MLMMLTANAYGNAHDAIIATLMMLMMLLWQMLMAMLMMLMANAYGNAHDAYGKCLWQCS